VSLALHEVTRPNLATFGWGRNDCGQLGFSPLTTATNTSSSSSSSCNVETASGFSTCGSFPPGVIPGPTRIGVLDEKDIVALSASLFNTAALTGELGVLLLGVLLLGGSTTWQHNVALQCGRTVWQDNLLCSHMAVHSK
jgi:hypothetical protein